MQETFPEIKNVLFYARQTLAIVVGCVFGFIPLIGATPLFAYVLRLTLGGTDAEYRMEKGTPVDVAIWRRYVAAELGFVWWYITSYLPVRIDPGDPDSGVLSSDPAGFTVTELISEGLMAAVANLLLFWIATYSVLYASS